MTINRRNLMLGAVSLSPLGGVCAQEMYPSRPIRIISPVGPGSGADTLLRRLSDPLAKLLGQPIIVENKAGAQSAIGARYVAKAPNDGYTLLLGGTSFVANVHMFKDPGYDPVKDFAPIAILIANPLLLTVRADLPVRTVKEFVKYAKDRPGKLTYGTGNAGSQVATQLLATKCGITAVAVPYPGMAQAMTDLLAGRVDFIMGDAVLVDHFVKSGKLRVLGVTSKQRLASQPDAAPLAELGVPDYEWVGWVGLFGPAGMPPAAVKRVSEAILKVIADPAVVQYIGEGGMIPAPAAPEAAAAYVRDQLKLWGRWTKDAGLTPT